MSRKRGGRQSEGLGQHVLFIRVTDDLVAALERHVAAYREHNPGKVYSKSDAVRVLLHQALAKEDSRG